MDHPKQFSPRRVSDNDGRHHRQNCLRVARHSPSAKFPHGRGVPDGFTLVELLVVIAIIAMLVTLLLPAVQAAREAARQTQCRNNLKNDALAVLNFVEVNSYFPKGVEGGDPTKIPASQRTEETSAGFCDRGFGWVTRILPFLEEQALYDQVFDSSGLKLGPNDKFPFPNILQFGPVILKTKVWRGGDQALPTFRCPSSALGDFAQNALPEYVNGYATSDYKGSNGYADQGIFNHMCDNARASLDRLGSSGNAAQGYNITLITPANVTDGMSKTLMIGESSYYVGVRTPTGGTGNTDWPLWIGGVASDEHTLFKTAEDAPINCGIRPKNIDNFFFGTRPGVSITEQFGGPLDDDCAFSWHVGGAMFAMCDGSVRFLEETIDFTTYRRLGQRNDGEPVSGY